MTESILSAGYLSQLLQRSPSEIIEAARQAAIEPRLSINGTTYFREADLPRIRAILQQPAKSRA